MLRGAICIYISGRTVYNNKTYYILFYLFVCLRATMFVFIMRAFNYEFCLFFFFYLVIYNLSICKYFFKYCCFQVFLCLGYYLFLSLFHSLAHSLTRSLIRSLTHSLISTYTHTYSTPFCFIRVHSYIHAFFISLFLTDRISLVRLFAYLFL